MSIAKGKVRRPPIRVSRTSENLAQSWPEYGFLDNVAEEIRETRVVLNKVSVVPRDPLDGELVYTGDKLLLGVSGSNGVELQQVWPAGGVQVSDLIIRLLEEMGIDPSEFGIEM